jgi:hypothetical protein
MLGYSFILSKARIENMQQSICFGCCGQGFHYRTHLPPIKGAPFSLTCSISATMRLRHGRQPSAQKPLAVMLAPGEASAKKD